MGTAAELSGFMAEKDGCRNTSKAQMLLGSSPSEKSHIRKFHLLQDSYCPALWKLRYYRHHSHTLCHLSCTPCQMKQILKLLVNLLQNVSCALKGTEKILGTANQREAI